MKQLLNSWGIFQHEPPPRSDAPGGRRPAGGLQGLDLHHGEPELQVKLKVQVELMDLVPLRA